MTTNNWWQHLRLRDVALGTVVVLLVVLGFVLLLMVRNVILSVFLGILLATGLRPVMVFLKRRNFPRFVAASISLALLCIAVVGFFVLILPLVQAKSSTLAEVLPQFMTDLRQQLLSSRIAIVQQMGEQLYPLSATLDTVSTYMATGQILVWLPTVGRMLFVIMSTILFTYYWLLYQERSLSGLLLLLSQDQRASVEAVWLQIEERIGAFVRGQILLALITAMLSFIGYWAIGLPHALALAIIAGLLEFIPFLGPFLATALAMITGLTVSPGLGLLALIIGFVVQQLENHVLVPRIMAKAVGINPVVTLLAFIGFAALFGPIGSFLAIPLAATLQVLFATWIAHHPITIAENIEGRGQLDKLRYQVQELSQDITQQLRTKPHVSVSDNQVADPEEQLGAVVVALHALLDQKSDTS